MLSTLISVIVMMKGGVIQPRHPIVVLGAAGVGCWLEWERHIGVSVFTVIMMKGGVIQRLCKSSEVRSHHIASRKM